MTVIISEISLLFHVNLLLDPTNVNQQTWTQVPNPCLPWHMHDMQTRSLFCLEKTHAMAINIHGFAIIILYLETTRFD